MPLDRFSNEETLLRTWHQMAIVGGTWAGISLGYLFVRRVFGVTDWLPARLDEALVLVFVVTWALGPPVWFAYETNMLIADDDKENKPGRMSRFRVGQAAAKTFWVGIGALVFFLAR